MYVVSSLLTVCCLTFADGPTNSPLLQTLPADGAWASFDLKVNVEDREIRTVWTARSVGKIDYQGKPCRFIELEQICDGPIVPAFGVVPIVNQCWRALVPEEEFGVGKNPLAHAVKIWVRNGDEPAVATPSIAARDVIVDALLRGPASDVKTEATPEKLAWQRGELTCDVRTGSNEIEFLGAKVRFDHRIFCNSEIPFGIAGLQQKIVATYDTMEFPAKLQLTLRDYGEGAKAKLPELGP